ncbi:MAG: sulfite exporter TauE/SafE family protein [Actinobacteria bacterium]|nr:MAG: sulfite exporter TauE/SafE family protein [Actinomycetota bacterium]
MVSDVDEPRNADDACGILTGAPAYARDERVPSVQPSQLGLSLRRHPCVLRSRNDRRERAVDVEQDRGALGLLGQQGDEVHAAYDTAVRLVLIGLVAGFFSALFGVGGGIIVVPLLLLLCRWTAHTATATSLAAIGVTALSGVITYALHGDVSVKYAALVGLPAAVGAVGGTTLQQRLRTRTIELLFAAFVLGTAVWMFLK